MRIRYITENNGRPVKKAMVYTQNEHGINFADVDTDAVYIIERLRAHGYETYIVGGAVRDLMLGKKPKDFDIVSGASPSRIKKTFRNARIIGRRFRLVHVYFGPKTFEVSTFRSLKDGPTSNTFGTIEEDVLRRDFSLNALFYDPGKQVVVDYVGGMKDIREKRIRPIIPLSVIFMDDPVRMIRAVKYAATTGFKFSLGVKWKIKRQSPLLVSIPSSRLTEELFKIIHSASASRIVENLEFFGLYEYLQPKASELMKKSAVFRTRYMKSLADLTGSGSSAEALAALIRDYLEDFVDWDGGIMENYKSAFFGARQFVMPINPPRADLDHAVRLIFGEHGITIKKSRFMERGKSWFPIVETPGPAEIPGGDGQKRRRRRRGRPKGGSGGESPEPEN
ncbi:MAG: polynucleotide adenylyltransferase PcnB [Spirochaetaceae bacterium]|nr:polynucleotide adenylyltransferase PcnB [Spirochaetaceae bacterium]